MASVITVKITKADGRVNVPVPSTSTVKEVLINNGVNFRTGVIHLDGSPITGPGQLDKTFEELGIKETCFLTSVVKTNNA